MALTKVSYSMIEGAVANVLDLALLVMALPMIRQLFKQPSIVAQGLCTPQRERTKLPAPSISTDQLHFLVQAEQTRFFL